MAIEEDAVNDQPTVSEPTAERSGTNSSYGDFAKALKPADFQEIRNK